MPRAKGFTLIELLIVVALILVIAAITIPCLVQSKISADEASAVASIRAINAAEISYEATYGGYADTLANLGGAEPCAKSATTACLLDQGLAQGVKSGYNFAAIGKSAGGGANATYIAGAAPVVFDHTGIRRFCSTEKNVIRVDPNSSGRITLPEAEECSQFKSLN